MSSASRPHLSRTSARDLIGSRTARLAAGIVVALAVVLSPLVPATASAASLPIHAAAASSPRVAIVRSAIAQGAPFGNQYFRVDAVKPWLDAEFGQENVSVIGDAALASVTTLRNYDVVVLVRQLAMTKTQRLALRSYVAGGGGVVAVFGAGRWDYSSTRSTHYITTIKLYPRPMREWGELTDIWGVAFYNDPITAVGYHVVGGPTSSHEILKMMASDLGPSTSVDMAGQKDANEYVTIPAGSAVTPLVHYTGARATGIPVNGSGWIAGWANQYGLGRTVYFGYQLTACPGTQARTLLVNSARWAGTTQSLTIATSASSPRIGNVFTLSGRFDPGDGMVGQTMYVEVWKPLKARWSYSSNRIVYAGTTGAALWQYKYTLKSGMAKGAYYFRAGYAGGVDSTRRMSPSVKVTVK